MAEFNVIGNKTVRCKNGHLISIPFQQTITKCPECNCEVFVSFHGTVINKNGEHVY